MPLSVVATLLGKPGAGHEIIRAFERVSPLVHSETGCELYAAFLERDGDTVVMVERWSSHEDLMRHAAGEPLRLLSRLTDHLLVKPYDVWFLDPVALGDPHKGVLPGVE